MNTDKFHDIYEIIKGIASIPLTVGAIAGAVWGGVFVLNSIEYRSGQHVGVVQEITEKRHQSFWRTYEGTMTLDDVAADEKTGKPIRWKFSLDDETRHGEPIDSIFDELRHAKDSGKPIAVKYSTALIGFNARGKTRNYVLHVEPITTEKK